MRICWFFGWSFYNSIVSLNQIKYSYKWIEVQLLKTVFTLLFFQYLILLFSGVFSLTDMVLSSMETEHWASHSMDQSELCNCQCDLGDADHVCTCNNHNSHSTDPATGPVWMDGFSCGSSVAYVPTEISSKYTIPVDNDIRIFASLYEFISEHPVYKGTANNTLFRPPKYLSWSIAEWSGSVCSIPLWFYRVFLFNSA